MLNGKDIPRLKRDNSVGGNDLGCALWETNPKYR